MDKDYRDIVIAGSGPAGLAAAAMAAGVGAKVLLLEKMPRPAVKMRASGGNKCNFTNVLPENEFMAAFGRNGRFMSHALAAGGRAWLLEYLRSHGVEPVIAEKIFYFPSAGRSGDVIDAFLQPAIAGKTELRCGVSLADIFTADGRVTGVALSDGTVVSCCRVILACGGEAAPALGGTDSGVVLAAKTGHRVVKMVPALAPLVTDEQWPGELAGVSLADALITAGKGREKRSSRNVLLFTKEGISGSAALNISGAVHRMLTDSGWKVNISVSFVPDMGIQDWENFLTGSRERDGAKFTRTTLSTFFPHSLAAVLCRNCVGEEFRNRELSRKKIQDFAQYLAAVPLTVSRHGGFRQAMAADGGVSLKEINPATMESRRIEGLYFAGEIVDLTGPCGGFNIQFAIASGRLAAKSALAGIDEAER